ncbi:hypothetical protein M8J75_016666 [Diaphorina citri]|nr:hypothetical protein M8J75_016666 [Diaphorina citri]
MDFTIPSNANMNNKLLCGSCSKIFSFKEKTPGFHGIRKSYVPLILNCGHTVCEFCIESSLRERGKVICPDCCKVSVCSQPVENVIKDHQMRMEFPPNVYLIGEIATSFNNKFGNTLSSTLLTQQGPAKKEELCYECSQVAAKLKCEQCGDRFCDVCFKSVHGRSKTLSKHTAVPLSPTNFDDELLVKQLQPVTDVKCRTHPSQYLAIYCNQCQVPVCPSCYLNTHKEHPVLSIEEKVRTGTCPIPQLSTQI